MKTLWSQLRVLVENSYITCTFLELFALKREESYVGPLTPVPPVRFFFWPYVLKKILLLQLAKMCYKTNNLTH